MLLIDHPRYTPKETLGQGAQGRVVRVIDRERPSLPLVAKIILTCASQFADAGSDSDHLPRLAGEFALLARLRAPGLVRVHDFGRDAQGRVFLIEDLVEGDDAIAAVNGVPDPHPAAQQQDDQARVSRLTALAADLAETLGALHDAGFVHGDVKPSNVRVPRSRTRSSSDSSSLPLPSSYSRAVLLDLGAAVASRGAVNAELVASSIHTPAFAAPEIRAGAPPSVAADLFGLGATLWACATKSSTRVGALRDRDRAPWVPPRLADLIGSLLSDHPADRPRCARDVLAALGRSTLSMSLVTETGAHTSRSPHVRDAEVRRILNVDVVTKTQRRVVYLDGPSGVGKSHLLREVMTRALLDGRQARLLTSSDWISGARDDSDPSFVPRLIAYLRGASSNLYQEPEGACDEQREARPLLLILDDLQAAPSEVVEAVESFRCMTQRAAYPVVLVAALRKAPASAGQRGGLEKITLDPLDDEAFEQLCRDENVQNARELAREAGGLPGWLFAALGRVPLTGEAALARVATLPARARAGSEAGPLRANENESENEKSARFLLALVATFGGTIPYSLVREEQALATCFEAGLLQREHDSVRLASPHLASDLAAALSSYPVSDRATTLALADTALPAAMLAAIARSPCPPELRTDLLTETARRARHEEARSLEIEALLALVADPSQRTATHLVRLERLTRDAGSARAHPQVLAWLAETAAQDETLLPLAERRRAEERARAGDMPTARAAADSALDLARQALDTRQEIYALATRGSIALWSADWATAADLFAKAHDAYANLERRDEDERGGDEHPAGIDHEEIARLEHNLGVVELYRGRASDAAVAFERSVVIKRALGDRAGVRACLLNLGLALTRLDRFDDAEAALTEATALAETLQQHAGRGWCLAARADLEVRRGRARDAERHVAEAEAIGDAVPKTVRADLVLLRVQIALLEGDGPSALESLERVDVDVRREDALVDARALTLEARARLCLLPVDRRGAARAAIAAIRRARAGDLPDAAREALDALHAARPSSSRTFPMVTRTTPEQGRHTGEQMKTDAVPDDEAWTVLRALGSEPPETCVALVAKLVVREARAERALIAEIDDGDAEPVVMRAWGVDLDGLSIAEPVLRVDVESVRAARGRAGALYQPDVTTPAGHGSRLALARGSLVIIVEHRFRSSAFDHVNSSSCAKWLTMGEIALRMLTSARSNNFATAGARPMERPIERPMERDDELPISVESHRSPSSASSSRQRRPTAPPTREAYLETAMPRREVIRDYPTIVGRSSALRRALAQLDAAVDADLPVLIEGETGTGKEVFARALHDHGQRRAGPFVAVNCAAIADSLFEAELFGHARGAFTGADRARAGLLARAEGGTLLLDEMGELALARQATLLRVLEERRYRPVGSDDERAFDVRVVAATNRDLEQQVEDGLFRKDLLYRLRVLRVVVPPLRERRGDVEPLLRHFLSRAGSRAQLTTATLELLESYTFPGNVRELQHLAQRLAASKLDRVDVSNLPREVRAAEVALAGNPTDRADFEREEVESALGRTHGNISRAAGLLGLTRHGLKKRMLRLGLRAKQSGS